MKFYSIKTSIKKYLLDNSELHCKDNVSFDVCCQKVSSSLFYDELSLIGFIPYCRHNKYWNVAQNINMNSDLHVSPHIIKFDSEDVCLPIFRRISFARNKKYLLNNKLFLESFLDKIEYIRPTSYIKDTDYPLRGDKILNLTNKIPYNKREDFVEKNFIAEDDCLFYEGREEDFELSGAISDMVCVTNDFCCLCSYINHITGDLKYVVLYSNDVMCVWTNNEINSTTETKINTH